MSDRSSIEWTQATWNPIRGCSRMSEGCRHCYAERVAARFSGPGMPYEGLVKFGKPSSARDPRWTGAVRYLPELLTQPLRWKRPRLVFVNSMSDLFHESLTNEQIAAVFGVMAATPRHTYQVLTKRAKRMCEWFAWAASAPKPYGGLPDHKGNNHARSVCCRCAWMVPGMDIATKGPIGLHPSDDVLEFQRGPWPLPNVWLGVSVENQAAADERIPELLATPAAVRWISAEPLIGPVRLDHMDVERAGNKDWCQIDALTGRHTDMGRPCPDVPRLSWVVAGCESGPGARPCDVAWLRSLRDQCARAGVPYFLKQAAVGRDPAFIDGLQVMSYAIDEGDGSHRKAGGVIGLPYLDGVQHKEMPK